MGEGHVSALSIRPRCRPVATLLNVEGRGWVAHGERGS